MWWVYVIIGVAVGLIDFTVGFRAGHRRADDLNRPVFQSLLDDLKQTTRQLKDEQAMSEWLRVQNGEAAKKLSEMQDKRKDDSVRLVPDTITTQLIKPDTVVATVRVSAQYDGEDWAAQEIHRRIVERLGEEALGRARLVREHDLIADEWLYTARVGMMPRR